MVNVLYDNWEEYNKKILIVALKIFSYKRLTGN